MRRWISIIQPDEQVALNYIRRPKHAQRDLERWLEKLYAEKKGGAKENCWLLPNYVNFVGYEIDKALPATTLTVHKNRKTV